jgi:hypothetical protein
MQDMCEKFKEGWASVIYYDFFFDSFLRQPIVADGRLTEVVSFSRFKLNLNSLH